MAVGNSHRIHLGGEITNPLTGTTQRTLEISDDNYISLKARAKAANMNVTAYVLDLLATGRTPFAAKTMDDVYEKTSYCKSRRVRV